MKGYDLAALKHCRFSMEIDGEYILPEELVTEILEWLPAKSIARYRCVSKYWSALFKSSSFIKNHRLKQGSKGTMLLLRRRLHPKQANADVLSFHDLDFPELEVRPSLSISFFKDLARRNRYRAVNLLGSCNGIVCIAYGTSCHILCNPALHEFKLLPRCPKRGKVDLVATGFGVASCTNDFKVIVMHRLVEQHLDTNLPSNGIVHLYNSRTNSWKQIDDAPLLPVVRFIHDVIFLNGACHWPGHTFVNDRKMILSFDMNTEVFRQLELPNCLSSLDIDIAVPVVMNECLCVVHYQNWDRKSEPVEVWVMKEYGVKESWIKQFVLSPQPCASIFLPWKSDMLILQEPRAGLPIHLITQYKDGEFDDQLDGHLTSITLCTNETKEFQVYGAECTTRAIIYEESLVSLT